MSEVTVTSPGGPATPVGRSEDLANVALDLELTSVCDAVCGFCPREYMPDKKSFMSMELIHRLADDIQNRPGFPVTLCGIGESMLHPQLDDIIKVLTEAGAKIEMTTNGGKMTAERFRELADLGVEGIHFSLNATSPDTHEAVMKLRNYDGIVKNVENVLKAKHESYRYTQVHVSFVVCNLNQHEIDEFVETWRPHKPNAIWLHPLNNRNTLLSPNVKPYTDMAAVKQRYSGDPQVLVDIFGEVPTRDNVCKIARAMMFVSVEGEMRLCAMDYKRTSSFGNLRTTRLHEMHSSKIERYMQGEMNDFCENCDFCPEALRAEHATAQA
jgi:organic radical activating enzyme